MKPFKRILGAVALTAAAIIAGGNTFAAPFIPGNVVVVQYGNGAANLSSTSAPAFVLEYLPSTSGQADPVQTIVIPTNGASELTVAGNSASEGYLATSLNNSNVTFAGYASPAGIPSVSSTAATVATGTNRVVGQLNASGNFITTAGGSTAFSGSNVRSCISDGTNYWMGGTGGSTTTNGGIWYSAAGGVPILITNGNFRVAKIFNGNLYYSTESGTDGIWVFNGIPTSKAPATHIITESGNAYDFAFNPAGTVCYIADENFGIYKYILTNSVWTQMLLFNTNNGVATFNNGCSGLAVNFSGPNPVLYATTDDPTNRLITITDTSAFTNTSDTFDQATILASAPYTNTITTFRGVAFAPPSTSTATAPTVLGISPSNTTNAVGSSVTFQLAGGTGYPTASNFWYEIQGTTTKTTNLVAGATAATLTLANLQLTNTAKYFAVLTNNSGSVTSSVASLTVILGTPNITGISPANVTTNAGQTVTFTLAGSFGIPTGSNFWFQITSTATNLVAGATGTTLTLTNVVGTNTASYFAIVSNTFGTSTSSVALLTVIDPVIEAQPSSAQGVVKGTVRFGVTVAGTPPITYQWYFTDTNGDFIAPAASPGDGSVISGANTSTLTFSNLQPADLTNFVVVASDAFGSVTSSVASTFSGTNLPAGTLPYVSGVLALWDFDGSQFTNTAVNPNSENNPVPFIGFGTASAVGTCFAPGNSPFSGSVDANDVGFDPSEGAFAFTPYGFDQLSPNFSWGTSSYPASGAAGVGTNKTDGVQFNVSTLGARNITISYDSRASATASEYERLQYTTNGTTWIDYPASSSFGGISSTYATYQYSLVGFPGVDNNTNFGFRVLTEFQNTATYGIGTTTNWVGVANTYGSGGTVTYDLVAVQGNAITNNNVPPAIGPFVNTNMVDTNTLVIGFNASSSQMAASNLTFSVVSLNTLSAGSFSATVNPTFVVTNTGSTNFLLSISFPGDFIPDPMDAAPILITATDTNGESAATSFLLTVAAINQPPTNTLTSLPVTNTLANTPITIPFTVGSARDPYANLTYAVASDNNTLIPAGNMVIGGNTGTGQLTLTITPAANQVGNSLLSVTVFDNDPAEPRSTTANISFIVRQNTNIVAVDDFDYDNSGSLDKIGTNYWSHVSGIAGQLQVQGNGNGDVAVVDTVDNTENLQAPLVGSPYKANGAAVLYASMTVNMSTTKLPTGNGSYFTAFNDGTLNTADVEGLIVACTNGAAPGMYRLGIVNVGGSNATNSQIFPQDLTPGVNYTVIESLAVSSGFSTLWVSPSNQASPSVTDTTATTLFNITDFELRESGSTAGSISVGSLAVGVSFNSVFYPPQANPDTYAVTENTTSLLSPLQNDGGWALNLTGLTLDGNETATVSGTNVSFTPDANFLGTATVGYAIQDNLGDTSSSTITVTVTNIPPLANPISYAVPENSVNDVLNPLTNDVVETPGGSLSLVSVSPTNGTATISGSEILFTPTSGFTGTATIGYTITDGIGGTSTSLVTAYVGNFAPIPLSTQFSAGQLVLTWGSPAFSLQTSTNVVGPYVTIPGATSPYTNLTTKATSFYRLILAP